MGAANALNFVPIFKVNVRPLQNLSEQGVFYVTSFMGIRGSQFQTFFGHELMFAT